MSDHPFRAIHANAWDDDPIDVPSLNRRVSDLLVARIEEVRRAGAEGREALRSTSVLLLGPAGSGKTHLFARLRKQTGPRAVFVHNRPEIGIEPTPRHVLAAVVRALRRQVIQEERRQVDLIVGTILAALADAKVRFPFAFLEDLQRQPPEAQRALVDRAITFCEERFPEIGAKYLERLLRVPFADPSEQRALFAWLSGEEPSQIELDRIGERGGLQDIDVLPALRTLGVVAAFGAPIVLVFDQLENLAEEEGRTGRIVAHARLVSELRDTVRGLVLVQMALDAEWVTRIRPVLQASDRARLEETIEMLALPTPDERRQLLAMWREALPAGDRGNAFPAPFTAAEVDAWTRMRGMTPRMLMQACGESYLRRSTTGGDVHEVHEPSPPPRAAFAARLDAAWAERAERARARIDEVEKEARGVPADAIRGGIIAALHLLGVRAEAVMTKGCPAIQIGNDAVRAEVLVAQHAHHTSLASAIRAATEIATQRKAILLRERSFAVRPTWKEVERLLGAFTAVRGAAFVAIDRDDVVRLIALEDLLSAARSQDLCGDDGRPIPYTEVVRWAGAQLGCADWTPVAAALGQPPSAPPPGSVQTVAPKGREGAVVAALHRLRVASLDRLVREAQHLDPAVSRATARSALEGLPVRWFGEVLVALCEERQQAAWAPSIPPPVERAPGELSVVEIRNALRCPRVFVLGRVHGRSVSFPIGASPAGPLFHRIAGSSWSERLVSLGQLAAESSEEELARAAEAWLLGRLVAELEANPLASTMPGEIDELAEALRERAQHLAAELHHACGAKAAPPGASAKRPAIELDTGIQGTHGEHVRITGAVDVVLHPGSSTAEVTEYKLGEEPEDELDPLQIALCRYVLSRGLDIHAAPTIVRHQPKVSATKLSLAEADVLAEGRLLPFLQQMSAWAERPETAPPPTRRDLCPSCPERITCAAHFPEPLLARDAPPAGATRPRPDAEGRLSVSPATEPLASALSDMPAKAEADELAGRIVQQLRRQGVRATSMGTTAGPQLVAIEVMSPGQPLAQLDRAEDDIEHRLAKFGVWYERRGPKRYFCAPRRTRRLVDLGTLLSRKAAFLRARPGRFVLGEGVDGEVVAGDLSDGSSGHLLLGGMAGSGKSVLLRAIVSSLSYFHLPSAVRFTLVDPTRVAFGTLVPALLAHLAGPILSDAAAVLPVLVELVAEMEERYQRFERRGAQNIDEYNISAATPLPRRIVIIDEFQGLMAVEMTRRRFLEVVQRLGSQARMAGIHLVLSTQRTDKTTLPEELKDHLYGRIALRVQNTSTSRVLLNQAGAESLLGQGDLLANLGHGLVRAQAPIV